MILISVLSIGFGAALGALLRWYFSIMLNPIFPNIPLGTLTANILGGFLIGLFMTLLKNHAFIPEALRLGLVTGFLGGLTTFSTFSAETVTLLSEHQYFWGGVIIFLHLGGSICATLLGVYTIKFFTF